MRGLEDLPDLRARVGQLVEDQQAMIETQREKILELRIQVETLLGALRKITGKPDPLTRLVDKICVRCNSPFETVKKHATLCPDCLSQVRIEVMARARQGKAKARAVGVAQT